MLSKVDELKLIARCVLADDRHAFGQLVDAYSPGLHTFIYNLTLGDAALTDDIAQETFLKAYTSLRSFKGLSRFRTWLYRIAIREFYDERRRRHESHMPEYADQLPSSETASGYAAECRHDVEQAMAVLNDTERTLILLFYYDDLPIKEISKITGHPEGTVKSYLSRAKSKMAKVLKS